MNIMKKLTKQYIPKIGAFSWGMLGILIVLVCWHFFTLPTIVIAPNDPLALEYQILMGNLPQHTALGASVRVPSNFVSPMDFWQSAHKQLADPWRHQNSNDVGIGIHLLVSLMRVAVGFLGAILVAVPLGVLLGSVAWLYKICAPIVQVLRPISPLAWMPILLYTIKDAGVSSVFVIGICALWPILLNTIFAVQNTPKSLVQVGQMLEFNRLKMASKILLPAALPAILAGMRIGMGVAWLVIIAAEMLVGSVGIGYFIWNQWNNLSLANILLAVLLIGMVGAMLDGLFGMIQKKWGYDVG